VRRPHDEVAPRAEHKPKLAHSDHGVKRPLCGAPQPRGWGKIWALATPSKLGEPGWRADQRLRIRVWSARRYARQAKSRGASRLLGCLKPKTRVPSGFIGAKHVAYYAVLAAAVERLQNDQQRLVAVGIQQILQLAMRPTCFSIAAFAVSCAQSEPARSSQHGRPRPARRTPSGLNERRHRCDSRGTIGAHLALDGSDKHRLGQQLLQALILIFRALQSLLLRKLQPSVLRLPLNRTDKFPLTDRENDEQRDREGGQ
jgi:hypothetical protein